ncbi:MAG: hypothetical protein GX811_12015, partial [Lentisphaerae bacterium]|nr:hypothetical protein [Lentisphaerota bacterium]
MQIALLISIVDVIGCRNFNFEDNRMNFVLDNLSALPRLVSDNCAYFFGKYPLSDVSHLPAAELEIPEDFFGICIAPSANPGYNDYLIQTLKGLGLKNVRVDMMETYATTVSKEFLERLHNEGFNICLHIVQRPMHAFNADKPQVNKQWRATLIKLLDLFGAKIEFVEIGSTVNRRKWTGYTIPSFLKTWNTAYDECKSRNIQVAAPNVTDFEPPYNITLLAAMRRMNKLPDYHTNNLFAERATEPEAFDHKILGTRLAPLHKFNFVKKARLLSHIAKSNNVKHTISTHVSWSLRRIARTLENTEEHQADYVSRYVCLSAISGGLSRMYWGPLIGQREGLIDDGTDYFPEMPHVSFYEKANGSVENYRLRPAFHAYKNAISFLSGSKYEGSAGRDPNLELHKFTHNSKFFHVVWTRNGRRALLSDCYPQSSIEGATFYSRDGIKLMEPPDTITESPTFISWENEPTAGNFPKTLRELNFAGGSERKFSAIESKGFFGVLTTELNGKKIGADFFEPSKLREAETELLRDTRNRIWEIKASSDTFVVKYYRPRNRARRILNMFRHGKPRR